MCIWLLQAVYGGEYYCGLFSADNGTAMALDGTYDHENGWSDPHACDQCEKADNDA